jgi:hypothetical protein
VIFGGEVGGELFELRERSIDARQCAVISWWADWLAIADFRIEFSAGRWHS